MILDLPGFDKITNKNTFGLIQCFYEEKMKPLTKQPVRFLIERSLSQGKQPVVSYKRVLTVHSDW